MTHRFTGTLSMGDLHRHIPHKFTVPEGTTRLEVSFDFSPRHPGTGPQGHEISLSLWDPNTSRGARHNCVDQSITLTHNRASLGYTPGPIEPGEWTVFVDTHRLLPPAAITYEIEIRLSDAPQDDVPAEFPAAPVASRGPGWYRGDLHGHSEHSDARWPVTDFIEYARGLELDFVTLSDHNTVSGIPEAKSLGGDDLLVIGGIELTTFWGHALAIGPERWAEWCVEDGVTMADLAQAHIDQGALFIIAHPMNVGLPHCSGCTWQYQELMPGISPAVEVWNCGWISGAHNDLAVQLYYGWLNRGHKLVATAGSDIHGPFRPDERAGYNTVYAEDLTRDAILAGLAKGHSYVSSGPKLSLGAGAAIMGDVLPAEETEIAISWRDCPPDATLRIVAGSGEKDSIRLIDQISAGTPGERQISFAPQGDWDWLTVEIRDSNNELHAMTNPLFFKG